MKKIFGLFLLCFTMYTVVAQEAFEEIFDLTTGSLNAQNGWTGDQLFLVVDDDMSLPNYLFQNSENKVVNIQSSGGTICRSNALTNPLITGTAYLSFLAKITDKNNLPASEDYQVGIGKTIFDNNFVGAGFFRDDNNGGVIKASCITGNVVDWVSSTQTFVENTVYHVVLKYQFNLLDNDSVFVFIADNIPGAEPSVPLLKTKVTGTGILDNIGSVILNAPQDSSDVLLVDGIFLGPTWSGFSSTLPVEFGNFYGHQVRSAVHLSWQTLTEINNQFFIVERSNDGQAFDAIGQMQATGDSQFRVDYEFIDKKPLEGPNYYRLKQMDFDGNNTYSKTIVVNVDSLKPNISIYPNPATEWVIIQIPEALQHSTIDISFFDASGRKIHQVISHEKHLIKVSADNLKAGIIFIKAYLGQNEVFSQKLLVKK